jgi:hypothetical protein
MTSPWILISSSRFSLIDERAQLARQKLCNVRRLQRIIAIAMEELKFATALPAKQEAHRPTALWAGGRRRVFGHGGLTLKGGSTTGLSVTENCRDWGW